MLLTQEEAASEGSAQCGRAQGQRGGHRDSGHWLGHGAGWRQLASRSLALGLLGPPQDPRALAAPPRRGSVLVPAVSTTIWRPHGLTASPRPEGFWSHLVAVLAIAPGREEALHRVSGFLAPDARGLGALSPRGKFEAAQIVKSLPAMQETRVRSLGSEDPLEKEMATHYSNLAWKIPWM